MISKIIAKLKKATTPYHITAGILTILAGYFLSPWGGFGVGAGFLIFERWDKAEIKTSKKDFKEFCIGMFCCVALLLLLKLVLFILRVLGVI